MVTVEPYGACRRGEEMTAPATPSSWRAGRPPTRWTAASSRDGAAQSPVARADGMATGGSPVEDHHRHVLPCLHGPGRAAALWLMISPRRAGDRRGGRSATVKWSGAQPPGRPGPASCPPGTGRMAGGEELRLLERPGPGPGQASDHDHDGDDHGQRPPAAVAARPRPRRCHAAPRRRWPPPRWSGRPLAASPAWGRGTPAGSAQAVRVGRAGGWGHRALPYRRRPPRRRPDGSGPGGGSSSARASSRTAKAAASSRSSASGAAAQTSTSSSGPERLVLGQQRAHPGHQGGHRGVGREGPAPVTAS